MEKQIQAPNGMGGPFSFPMSQMNATQLQGGNVKIVDSTIFNISTTIAAAEVNVEPGAIRELHVSEFVSAHPMNSMSKFTDFI